MDQSVRIQNKIRMSDFRQRSIRTMEGIRDHGLRFTGLRTKDGGWRMEDGGWRIEDGGWRMED